MTTDLAALADALMEKARAATNGRAADTIEGGSGHSLRQTVLALTVGSELGEHESPGEATLQVLTGRVRLLVGDEQLDAATGDYVELPRSRHALAADEDSVLLLTVLAH